MNVMDLWTAIQEDRGQQRANEQYHQSALLENASHRINIMAKYTIMKRERMDTRKLHTPTSLVDILFNKGMIQPTS